MSDEEPPSLPRFEPLGKLHNRAAFSCSHPELTNYIKQYALQDAKKNISATSVLLVSDSTTIVAYHTLSASRVDLDLLPDDLARKYPKYAEGLPATLLGRLAVADGYEGKGFGGHALMNALEAAFSASDVIGSAFVLVRAIDDRAHRFYCHFGFVSFPGQPRRLFLPMATIGQLLAESE